MQNPEGSAQMDGPEEAMQESARLLATLLPRKRGHSRVTTASWIMLVTRLRGRVVMGLYILYPLKIPLQSNREGHPETEVRVFL